MIIGLTGQAQSGKTTIAMELVKRGFVKLSLADPIKEILTKIYDLSPAQISGYLKEEIDPRYDISPRFMMQMLGTEVARNIHEDTWVMHLHRRILGHQYDDPMVNIVVDDIRYDNEAEGIRSWGGCIVGILRPKSRSIESDHSSEYGLTDPPDWEYLNDGDLTEIPESLPALLKDVEAQLKKEKL